MALEDDIRRLARIPLLAELELDALRLIAFSAEARILRAGDVIFRAGDTSDAGYFIMSGSIALDPSGPGSARRTLGPDALIGEMALISASKRSVTAVAREPSAVLKISRAQFHRVLEEFPVSALRVRKAISARLVAFAGELEAARSFAAEPTP